METKLGWAFLEQLALAALDVGRIDVADVRPSPISCSHFFNDVNDKVSLCYIAMPPSTF